MVWAGTAPRPQPSAAPFSHSTSYSAPVKGQPAVNQGVYPTGPKEGLMYIVPLSV